VSAACITLPRQQSRNHLVVGPPFQVFNAMGNDLSSLPDSFGGLTSLMRLGLKSNQLRQLPSSFW